VDSAAGLRRLLRAFFVWGSAVASLVAVDAARSFAVEVAVEVAFGLLSASVACVREAVLDKEKLELRG